MEEPCTTTIASEPHIDTGELLEELASDYSCAFRVDSSSEKHALEEGIDDLLNRLDEFTGLLNMVRSDNTLCLAQTLPDIYAKSKEFEKVFKRIDALESFVGVVRESVDTMEEKVNEVENALGVNSVKKFLSSLPTPLFSKRSTQQYKKQLRYEAPEIFKCSDYLATVSADDPLPMSVSNFSLDDTISDRSVDDDPMSPTA
ncbi:biogenesis of lysosome-related organelles complex 1 subunit 4-like [Ornithodoros turicata]